MRWAPPTARASATTRWPSATGPAPCCASTRRTSASRASRNARPWPIWSRWPAASPCRSSRTSAAAMRRPRLPAWRSLDAEPTVQQSVAAGVDVVCFSGDKLLGGPQAGVIVGRAEWVSRLRKHPLMRALRVDKLTYAALEATLGEHLAERAWDTVPVLRMASLPVEAIAVRAEILAAALRAAGLTVALMDGHSTIGGGSAPGSALAHAPGRGDSPHVVGRRLRRGPARHGSAGHRPHRGRPRADRPAHSRARRRSSDSCRLDQQRVTSARHRLGLTSRLRAIAPS